MSALIVWHHAGLGDHLICNGLVNYLADQHDVIYLPCKRAYLETIRCLYVDQPKVEVFPVDRWPDDVERFRRNRQCEILRVGHEQADQRKFDVSFYRQVGIPFEVRYTRVALPHIIPHEDELYERLAPGREYCLIHREGSLGVFKLAFTPTLPVVYVEQKTDPFKNLLAYRKLICHAAEIHCINSSVIHLVDSLPTNASLFYHDVKPINFTLRPAWAFVAYSGHPVRRFCRRAVARARLIWARV